MQISTFSELWNDKYSVLQILYHSLRGSKDSHSEPKQKTGAAFFHYSRKNLFWVAMAGTSHRFLPLFSRDFGVWLEEVWLVPVWQPVFLAGKVRSSFFKLFLHFPSLLHSHTAFLFLSSVQIWFDCRFRFSLTLGLQYEAVVNDSTQRNGDRDGKHHCGVVGGR